MSTHANDLDIPLNGKQLWLAGIVLAFANFLVVLDTTIANVSIPNIAGGLSVSPTQGTWVITSYAVADAISVPLTGWLAARFGPVRVFAWAITMFAFWSFVCGLSHTLGLLVAARIMQGFSGGPMIPLSQTLLLRIFGPARAGAATGIWAVTTLLAPICGPILGGEICDRLSWPWIFYVNVPIAVICAFAAWRILGKRDDKPVSTPIDFVGLGLLVLWVGAMQIMLDKGRELDWFASAFIIELALTAVIGFVAFVLWELTSENPVVDLTVFRSRSFTFSCMVLGIGYGAFFSSWIIVPLWLQVNMGYPAATAGHVSALNGIFAVLMAPVVVKLLPKVDSRALVSVGLIFAALVMLSRTWFAPNIDMRGIAIPNLMQGMCVPFFFMPLMSLSLVDFSGKKVASAAGLVNFTRTTAAAFGASLVVSKWDNAAIVAHSEISRAMTNSDDVIKQLQNQGSSIAQARMQLETMVTSQSVMIATTEIFYWLAIVLAVGGLVIWFVPRPKKPVALSAGH